SIPFPKGPSEDATAAPALQTVDIVLECTYVGEGQRGAPDPGAFGGSFSKDPATLVLRGASVRGDGSLGDATDYNVPREKADSASRLVFEVSAPLVPIPHAEALLHADCNGEEVNCEISPYDFQQRGKGPCWFMGTLRLSSGISIALVLRGPHCSGEQAEKPDAILHPKLRIPLSEKGTVLTTVEFQSSSRSTSLQTHLGSLVTLDCHFASAPSSPLSSLEWRRQHRGSGRSLFRYQAGSTGARVEPKVHVDLPQLLGSGDASLNLQGVSVGDEGTYICLVSTPQHQIQQIIQLQVAEPPRVRVIPAQVSFERDVTTTLTCHIDGYYPLDVLVSWTQKTAEDEAEITLSSTYFSSHLQNHDGTYSISSYLSISSATVQAPATYSCRVSHVALEEPVLVSAYLKATEDTRSEGLVGGLIATAIFIIVLFMALRRKK
ncbi:TPSNR protein, partial [Eudromia elegans]|nr:TPSNR protein [Eudromia elegans]